jgi:hypothetical protein
VALADTRNPARRLVIMVFWLLEDGKPDRTGRFGLASLIMGTAPLEHGVTGPKQP